MYKSSKEFIKNELSKERIKPLYRIFEDANIIYKEVLQSEFFNSKFISNINGRLISYAVYRQFDSLYLPRNFPFQVNTVKMPFGQKRVELKKDNILLTIGKSNSRNCLPSISKYKKDYSSSNWGLENQIRMDIINDGIKLSQTPYYAILTFDIKDGELDFVDILIPDHRYENILDKIELKPKFKVHRTKDIKNDDDRILSIKNIKKEIINTGLTQIEGE